MTRLFAALLLITLTLGGCQYLAFLRADGVCTQMPFTEGDKAQITEITVRPNVKYGAQAMLAETDPDMIRDFYSFLQARRTGWRAPVGGVPAGEYLVTLSRGDKQITEVGVGPGYVTAPGCEGYAYTRQLSGGETAELEQILGIELSRR